VSHGVLGCHADGVDGWWASLPGPGFRIIAPSRFGYFGSSLPPGATPAAQADAYAVLLDHLGIGRAVVLGFSAGSGSVLEFGLRHPHRVVGLILANCRLGGGVAVSRAFAPVFRLAYSADRLFWVFKQLMPTAFSQMMGVSQGVPTRSSGSKSAAGLTCFRVSASSCTFRGGAWAGRYGWLDQAFGPLGLARVTLHIDVENQRSRALADRLGFTEEGVHRQAVGFPDGRRDEVVYGLLAAEWLAAHQAGSDRLPVATQREARGRDPQQDLSRSSCG
jgi:pimeloyl-ACP methyl ester carboxylesterase